HHADIFDTPERALCDIFATAKKMAAAIMKTTNCDGINIGMNNKPAAGQVVFHAHVHVIPRLLDDGLKPWPHKEATPEQQATTASAIKANI
ncbi:MAG: HIT family protein, partial [Nanoarchaeota archaeon]